MADYLSTPLRTLHSADEATLMSGVLRDGTRVQDKRRKSLLHYDQMYYIRNNHVVLDRGESTVYGPAPNGVSVTSTDKNLFDIAVPLYNIKSARTGSILGYIIKEVDAADGTPGRELLKIHYHGDTTNPLSSTFKAFFRSPVQKWDVENWGLFTDIRKGTNLGLIQDVFPDSRVFLPAGPLTSMPRLEMQYASALGARYWLAVTDIPEPVGEVDSSILGRFAPRSEAYMMNLKHCTREEAVLWLTMVVATDMKRRKSQTARVGGTPFLYI